MNIEEQQQTAFDFQDFTQNHLNKKTVVGYSDHQFLRLNVLNTRSLKDARVVEFLHDDIFYKLTSRMSSVHLTIMELIFKLTGSNIVREKTGTTTMFFDMSELVKYYPQNTNSAFLIQKIQELGGFIDSDGFKKGTFLQAWSFDDFMIERFEQFKNVDSEVSSAGGVVLQSGYADGKGGCDYIVKKDEELKEISRKKIANLKDSDKKNMKSTNYYFYVTFSNAWIDFINHSKLLKTATIKGILEVGSINSARLQSISRYMCGQKPGVSRSLDFIVDYLELKDGITDKTWIKTKSRLLTDIKKYKVHLDALGIAFDFEKESFLRTSNKEVSVIENK